MIPHMSPFHDIVIKKTFFGWYYKVVRFCNQISLPLLAANSHKANKQSNIQNSCTPTVWFNWCILTQSVTLWKRQQTEMAASPETCFLRSPVFPQPLRRSNRDLRIFKGFLTYVQLLAVVSHADLKQRCYHYLYFNIVLFHCNLSLDSPSPSVSQVTIQDLWPMLTLDLFACFSCLLVMTFTCLVTCEFAFN